MSQHTLATGRAATLIKLAFAAGAKLSAAFIAFGLTALVTRNMPNDEAGLFLLGFSILAVLSQFFRLGLDNVVLRFLVWILTLVVPATLAGVITSDLIATYIFNKPAFGSVLGWMLCALPAMALFMLLAMAFQAQHRVVLTTVFQNLGISAVFIIGFGTASYVDPLLLNSIVAAQVYCGAAFIILVLAFIIWFGQRDVAFSFKGYKDSELHIASKNLWLASNMSLITQWSGLLVAGAMVSSVDLAYFSAAQRTAMLVTFVLMVVNMVVSPRFAKMWKDQDLAGMRRLAKWSTRGMIVMAAPVVLVMIVFPDNVMSFFGDGYEQAGFLLSIMAIGQFINVATGSVGYLLNMSGHEREYRQVMLITGPLSILISLVLTYFYGAEGAAVATALNVGMQNLFALLMVRSRLGFWSIG